MTPLHPTLLHFCVSSKRRGVKAHGTRKAHLKPGVHGRGAGLPGASTRLRPREHLRKAFVAPEEAVAMLAGPQLYSVGPDRPRHLQKTDGQASRGQHRSKHQGSVFIQVCEMHTSADPSAAANVRGLLTLPPNHVMCEGAGGCGVFAYNGHRWFP